jgi:hypothetical protein
LPGLQILHERKTGIGEVVIDAEKLEVETEFKCHYRVDPQAGNEGCDRCHAGTFWTIVYREKGSTEDTEIGTAWGDKELAEDICDLMNMAYEAGKEAAGEPK